MDDISLIARGTRKPLRYLSHYRTPNFIRDCVNFNGGHFRGEWTPWDTIDVDASYVVYSYSTVIAEYLDGVWYQNETSYSITTSKHQSYVRQALYSLNNSDDVVHVYRVPQGARHLPFYARGPVVQDRIKRIRADYLANLVWDDVWDNE